jgi:hypothetical protein
MFNFRPFPCGREPRNFLPDVKTVYLSDNLKRIEKLRRAGRQRQSPRCLSGFPRALEPIAPKAEYAKLKQLGVPGRTEKSYFATLSAEDVVSYSDGGGLVRAARVPVSGRKRVGARTEEQLRQNLGTADWKLIRASGGARRCECNDACVSVLVPTPVRGADTSSGRRCAGCLRRTNMAQSGCARKLSFWISSIVNHEGSRNPGFPTLPSR